MIEIIPPAKPKYILDFAIDACIYLGIYGLKGREIEINIHNRLEDECYGLCAADKWHAEVSLARNTYDEKIDRQTMLKTLAHELVHVKQYFMGELKDPSKVGRYSLWKGEKVDWKNKDKTLPWEREAYRLENIIYEQIVGS